MTPEDSQSLGVILACTVLINDIKSQPHNVIYQFWPPPKKTFIFLFTVVYCILQFYPRAFFFLSETQIILQKNIVYRVSDKWLSHHNAFKFNLSSGALNAPSWIEQISTFLLTFWMLCQQSTANCVRDYALRVAAQCHKFLTGTTRPLLYWALNPPHPIHLTPSTLPLHNSPGKAEALFSAIGPNAWHTNYITAMQAFFLLLHFFSVP